MGREETEMFRIVEQFETKGVPESVAAHGNGHINDTCLVVCKTDSGYKKYILQRINHDIFKKPAELMENVVRVTEFLRRKIAEEGGDPERETLRVIPVKGGAPYYQREDGTCWRMYGFIDGASCYDEVKDPQDFY